jgi:hypothetical protein
MMLTRLEMIARSVGRKYLPRKPMPRLGYDPYNKDACKQIANELLDEMYSEPDKSPLETCQRVIKIMGISYPTVELADEYFRNLEILLSGMSVLEKPGQLVIGAGPGRCGSTSLAAMLGTVPNSCCTHESPPPIFWDPQREQIDFHIRRFRALTKVYSLVSDVSHWWLNSVDEVYEQFSDTRIIGLIRDPADCAMSFMRVQGFGKGSYNPWVMHGGEFWRSGHWDPTYPCYALPNYTSKSPDRAKIELITRYVREYNERLIEMARKTPDRVKLVRTQELGDERAQLEIFQFANARGQTSSWKLNVKGTTDGRKLQIKF